MTSWTFANAHDWMPEPPIDPPMTDFDKYEYQWEYWLNDNYDEKTHTVFGIDNDDNDELMDKLWDKFMAEVIDVYYEP